MLSISLQGDQALIAKIGRMPDSLYRAMKAKLLALALKLQRKIVTEKLSGQVLHKRTGALASSIDHKWISESKNNLIIAVGSLKSVPYAAIHEFGGTTRPHIIEPVKAEVLAFVAGGKQRFAKIVHHPGSKIPERSYIRSSLEEMKDEIVEGIKEAGVEGIKNA